MRYAIFRGGDGLPPPEVQRRKLERLPYDVALEEAAVTRRGQRSLVSHVRRLKAQDVRVGAFTDAPEPLARVAAAQLGAPLAALTSGAGSLERLLAELGGDAVVVRSPEELVS